MKTRNAPILRADPSSVSNQMIQKSDLIIGNMIPPARAVLLGVAGARIKSTPTIEYAKPNVFTK